MVVDAQTRWSATPLPWQSDEFERLLVMQQQERLPHALMLVGPEGCGKRILAATLAASLLCHKRSGGSCGTCDGCLLAKAGSHGDSRWLEPEEGKRAIGIDPVREAIRFTQQTAGYGQHKVLIVSPAEAMTTSAANAILKTLEEPPGNSFIIFVCHRPGDLPATVRSRCQKVTVPAPDQGQALMWLGEQGLEADLARQAFDVSGGRVMAALAMARTGVLEGRAAIRRTFEQLLEASLAPAGAAADLSKVELETVLETGLSVLQHRLKSHSKSELHKNQAMFLLCDDISQWCAAVRGGLNLTREGLILQLCMRISTVTKLR